MTAAPPPHPLTDSDDESLSDAPSSSRPRWVLGFLAPPPSATALLRHRFQSKLGGRPAWLDPVHLPHPSSLTCAATGAPLDFLLQVYAPVDGVEAAFHRVLFIFVSPHGHLLHRPGAVRAFRCQLPRNNPYYPPVPASDGDVWPRPAVGAAAAAVVEDRWRVAEAEAAGAAGALPPPPAPGTHLYPEAEVVVEDESSEDEADLAALAADYEMGTAADGDGNDGDTTTTTLPDDDAADAALADAVEAAAPADARALAAFSAAVARAPSQVLRYCFAAAARPRWPRAAPKPPPTPPPCPRCGGPRAFELQVLPQLLACLGRDAADAAAPDFAAAGVWSCAASCGGGGGGSGGDGSAYMEEFVWVQPGDGQE